MTLRKVLTALVREIADEADRNPAFRDRLELALDRATGASEASSRKGNPKLDEPKRPSNRRAKAALDPVQLARQGDDVLRTALARLDIEQLRDVVAEYGMDTGKLVIKWRGADRIIDRIVEVARQRAHKGSSFLDQGSGDSLNRKQADPDRSQTGEGH